MGALQVDRLQKMIEDKITCLMLTDACSKAGVEKEENQFYKKMVFLIFGERTGQGTTVHTTTRLSRFGATPGTLHWKTNRDYLKCAHNLQKRNTKDETETIPAKISPRLRTPSRKEP